MKSIRLLPVVIFAALALLVFKGIGLVTNGSYVLTGATEVAAAGGAPDAAEPAILPDGSMASQDLTIADTSPTLDDMSPTMASRAEPAADHGGSAEASSAAETSGETEQVTSSETAEAVACPAGAAQPAADGGHDEAGLDATIGDALAAGCPPVSAPVDQFGDAIPMIQDGAGKIVPLQAAEGDRSETALLERLGERRGELDQRETDLAMRTALLEAAEKRLDERTRELAALEARIATLVDQKKAEEEAGFRAVVSMYETMKAKDAAKIFDTLDLPIMLKVARAMSPRKMSPILAAMSARPAEALTTAMTMADPLLPVVGSGENLAGLPQIVGQ